MSTWSGFVTIFSEWPEDENHAESSLGKGEGGMQRSAGHRLAPAISWGEMKRILNCSTGAPCLGYKLLSIIWQRLVNAANVQSLQLSTRNRLLPLFC